MRRRSTPTCCAWCSRKYKEWQAQGEEIDVCAIGNKGLGFMQRMGANVVSQVVQLGDRPHMEKLIGAVKVMLDGYIGRTASTGDARPTTASSTR